MSYPWTVAGPRSNRDPKRPRTEFAPDPEPKKRNDDSQLVNVVSLIEIISIWNKSITVGQGDNTS